MGAVRKEWQDGERLLQKAPAELVTCRQTKVVQLGGGPQAPPGVALCVSWDRCKVNWVMMKQPKGLPHSNRDLVLVADTCKSHHEHEASRTAVIRGPVLSRKGFVCTKQLHFQRQDHEREPTEAHGDSGFQTCMCHTKRGHRSAAVK